MKVECLPRGIYLHVAFVLPPLALERHLGALRGGQSIFTEFIITMDQVLSDGHPIFIASQHSEPSLLKSLNLFGASLYYKNTFNASL